jgi:PAS domain S-box-containing protein
MAHEFGSHASPITISSLLHALPAGVALLNDQGVILEVNQSWNVFGAANGRPDPQSAVGTHYLDFCGASAEPGSAHADRVGDSLQSILAGTLERFEWVHRADAGGAVRWFHLIATPIALDQERTGAMVMHFDVSEEHAASEALRQNEARFRALVEYGFDGIAVIDQDGIVRYASPAGIRTLGFGQSELVGHHFEQLTTEKEEAFRLFGQVKEQPDVPIRGRLHLRRKNGLVRLIEFVASNRLSEPSIRGIVCNFTDVTEQFDAERTLRNTEAKLRGLFESNVVNITFGDATGHIHEANDAFLEMVGATRAELEAGELNWMTLTPPESLATNIAAHEELSRAGKVTAFEKQYQRHDGSRVWTLMSLAKLPGTDGETVALSIDVTQKKAIEQALIDSERKFSKIFETSPLAIYISDLHSDRIVESNPAFSRLSGYSQQEALDRTGAELQLWEDPSMRDTLLARLRAGETVTNVEALFTAKGGQRRRVLVSFDRLELPGRGSEAVVAVMVDITDRHQLEEQFRQAQKMEAVGRLAGGVAHDFNNLLTAIIGYSELLTSHEGLPADAAVDLQEILKAGHSAASLTRQLLAFSRQQALEPKVFDLNDEIRHVSGIVGRLVGEDVKIVTTLDPNLALIQADAGQIEQVIFNLAVNARDAMPAGGVLTIETSNVVLDDSFVAHHRGAAIGPHVMLSVGDTGVGMDDEVKLRLFEPFFTTKERGKGTGLGLATIYGIVKQSGGSIWVYSELGLGSTFKIYLPSTSEPRSDIAQQPEPSQLTGTETILVVEDQEDVRALVRQSLTRHGYDVLTAATPSEAQRLALGRKLDLLLTDVVMPEMSGRVLARTLHESMPRLRVLYMSGYADDTVVRHGLVEAGLELLQKPFTVRALVSRVRQVLDAPERATPA